MMTIRSPLIVVLAALILTACAIAEAERNSATAIANRGPTNAAFHCALRLSQTNGQVAVEARVQSPDTVSGSYALHIVGADGGTAIHQSGDFQAAGQTPVILGSAALSGSAADYATTLTVRTKGQVFDCPVERR